MPWSKEQKEAITVRGKDILVAAAAGSGKTAVLVERIMNLLLYDKMDINEILVVTFTNAAAAEMRDRIGKKLEENLSLAAQDGHVDIVKKLERQLILLNAADISTLHSFCQSIIRRNFHKIDVDPKFRLAGEQEITLLKQDVLAELLQEEYERDNNELFLQFVDSYGSERGDDAVYEIILHVYEYAVSQPFPQQWLNELPRHFMLAANGKIEDTIWMDIAKADIKEGLEECFCLNSAMEKAVTQAGSKVKAIAEDFVLLTDISDVLLSSWKDLYIVMSELKFSVMRLPEDIPDELKEWLKSKRKRIKDIIFSLTKDFFQMPPEKLMQDLRGQQANIEFICALTNEFMRNFGMAKHERTIADFDDLEHFALQILAAPESTAHKLLPTEQAKELHKKYKEIMVDEYQDTNGVQEAIISLAAGENHNKFLVGDVKQSIYRFRLAEPRLFLEKYNNYPQKPEFHQRIDLIKNFRSRENILQAVNFIFFQTMTEKAAEINYGEKEALSCGLPYPDDDNSLAGPVELILLEKDKKLLSICTETGEDDDENLTGFGVEADCIAKRIKKLINEGKKVFDKKSGRYRLLTYKDIVILMRSVVGKADKLLEVLRDNDIPSYAAVNSGYFAETEVRIMISLLQIIDNPHQDIPLAAVLYSPIVNLTTEELGQIRLCDADSDLFSALMKACQAGVTVDVELKDKLAEFLQHLKQWRSLARQCSVPELIWQLYDDTGYYDYCAGMPSGLLRQANLRMLYDRAADYEETDYRGLFRFLRFVDKMKKNGNDLSVARTLGENEDVVRIMTIHKSKGLEFPVVIIADLGKKINLADSRQALLIHKKYGLGPYVYDNRYNVRYPTFARQTIARQIIKESKAEELRVLYVAMTRAREKLILTGTVRNIEKAAAGWCENLADALTLPAYKVLNANTYLDWICPALSRHKDGQVFFQLCKQLQPEKNISLPYENSSWKIKIKESFTAKTKKEAVDAVNVFKMIKKKQFFPATTSKDWVDRRLSWHYPEQFNIDIPSKLSVTEIKHRLEPVDDAVNLFADNDYVRPQFLQKSSAMTGSEYGTLMHSVMQHLALTGSFTEEEIKEQLNKMAADEIILPSHIAYVNCQSIRKFIYSPIGKRMRCSNNVRREMQFSRMLAAARFYDVPSDKKIFIQGVVDLLFSEDDGLVLVDYKTDNCTVGDAVRRYNVQLNLYSQAVADILKEKVKERYLYLFHSGEIIRI
ncbi:helicase-exonuclease AddAB subunit AddA [Pectinatus sottacetonis]|uniref:helicase-exonuclease AddAB subunit AddA n=1 Tax=Pectinatus sottacetonis TaxID=1002795 RepID=UPI0018C66E76|nr:helicase-exonuclease AddAB subunit AddA [Pectinatus sottacetonis]